VLRIIPTDPFWLPSAAAFAAIGSALSRHPSIAYIDPGVPFVAIGCPACGAALTEGWWRERMEAGYDSERDAYEVLTVEPPCCERLVSLNDLAYDPPAGFARAWVVAGPDELARVAATLGHAVRAVSGRP
jgi:DNA-directed RNA polymerase subunit N (RpoN/RPB10)